jgi:hypothetical protein
MKNKNEKGIAVGGTMTYYLRQTGTLREADYTAAWRGVRAS